jgi:hypothetical protein
MNTAALKAFAPVVRRQLLEAVSRKLDFVLAAQTPDYLTTYAPQVAALRNLAQADRTGLIERVAYTWFNRLTALRYLDARGWHPFRARVITPASAKETQPEILKLMRNGALPAELKQHTNPVRLNDLLDGHIPSPDPQGEVYRHLVLAACHFYHALLQDVFERIDDETELLLPDDLLTEHSVARPFRTEITDDDCSEVEIIGWLYQFYISERKDEVMARKSAVPKEDIPAVTQLFTPHWIVRYLVENSLGRLWLLNRPDSQLREQMPYYIEGEAETDFLRITRPEEIRVLDPAAGSGHMLTYAFDLLYAIYEEEGYPANDIPALILKHNLHGLDICPRAVQLAELALLFKARERSRRFFQPEYLVRPRVIELHEVRFAEHELRVYIHALDLGGLFDEALLQLMHQFEEAKNFGSLIQPCLDEHTIAFVRDSVESKALGGQLFLHETHFKVLRVLEQAEALTQRYHIVVANPPYMSAGAYSSPLKQYVLSTYQRGKADLYGCFLERCSSLVVEYGLYGMITIPNWMFLEAFADLREWLLSKQSLLSLIHLGRGVFGADFGSVAFVFRNSTRGLAAIFRKLFTKFSLVADNESLEQVFHAAPDIRLDPRILTVIPGAPLAYWLSSRLLDAFRSGTPLGELARPRQGIKTGNNDLFLRFWWEVADNRSNFAAHSIRSACESSRRWFPCTKGGPFRKWYGNHDYVVNWENDGEEIRSYTGGSDRIRSRPQNTQYFFRRGVTWSKISISSLSARLFPSGFCFESIGSVCFSEMERTDFTILSLLNSCVSGEILQAISPSVDFGEGAIAKVPVIDVDENEVFRITAGTIGLARADWDSFETSRDFCDQPVLRPCLKGTTIEASWQNWEAQCTSAIRRMQELETENNRLFIDAYGLQDELSPEVLEEQITLARPDARRDMAAFLSYAVGCMMGRYALDHPGLILVNAGDSTREFLEKVNLPQESLTFAPHEDGIVPVLDGEWFENDIVARTREFLRATFGDATLRENIRFIEDSLGKDLRKYFVADFYKDHLQTFKRRPIYWMVQSPRKSFSVLVYLHRYTRDTMNIVLNRYLREYEVKLRNRIERLTQTLAGANISTRDKTAARKESDKLIKALHDCEEWERQTVLPLAQARIELDLDDGVKTNYLKLGEALAPIPGLAAADE